MPTEKGSLSQIEFPHVKDLKNASGSPKIGTACGGASTRKIRSVPGGESAMRLRLGRRFVNLVPLAQRTKTPHKRAHPIVIVGTLV